ncbi:peptidoglycan-binding domain-containing protein [Dictyobacter aurantiacus]|uniref:Peptidoglycan binding-like domain-containing protein n=1 Tax=Dictyobacter aurantiacus TaxID=1936993 RepID=A0A401ZL63_9CHLR|nr:peptidoglycan-binding protein [Dictyobacter aurantiacus]GCE07617.1 hypothetical protein KDAU_49460 [Dictyobacter aurantiacus]
MRKPLSLLWRVSPLFVAAILMALFGVVQTTHAARSWPTYQSGASGENVRSIQYMLAQRGYSLTVDGQFGPATASVVKSFQSNSGLSVDGIVGSQTWEKLIVTTQNGSNGDAVTALQRQLNAHGASLTVDGSFGPATEAAVKSFQSSNGLSADGIAGLDTWSRLVGGSGSGGSEGDKLTQSQAASMLSNAGISVTSSGGCTDRYNSSCTSLDQIRRGTIDGVIAFKNASGCAITITGGTETGHASGTYSHWNGYKVDVAHTTCVTDYIHTHFTYKGLRGDGAPMYDDASGNRYADEGSHWDITYY